MARQIALIRGINVGRAKRVAMKDLREVIQKLGGTDVRTVLNSGNAIFTPPKAGITADDLEAAMAERLGVSGRVTMLSGRDFEAILREDPFKGVSTNPARQLIAFLRNSGGRTGLGRLAKHDWSPETLVVGRRAAHLWCPEGIGSGRLFEAVNKALGDGVTMRNLATVMRIRETAGLNSTTKE